MISINGGKAEITLLLALYHLTCNLGENQCFAIVFIDMPMIWMGNVNMYVYIFKSTRHNIGGLQFY